MTEVRKKDTICATVSPYLKRRVEELVASHEFSSMSDLVNIALTKFIHEYEIEKRTKAIQDEKKRPPAFPVEDEFERRKKIAEILAEREEGPEDSLPEAVKRQMAGLPIGPDDDKDFCETLRKELEREIEEEINAAPPGTVRYIEIK